MCRIYKGVAILLEHINTKKSGWNKSVSSSDKNIEIDMRIALLILMGTH